MMAAQEHVEAVTAGHEAGTEQGTKHQPKLIAANARIFPADFLYVFQDGALTFQL